MADSSLADGPPGPADGDEVDPSAQEFCLAKGVGAAISGAVMGGLFGTGAGLLKREKFKVALAEGGSSSKTFAIMSAVHSLVVCYLKRFRHKEDAINSGIAGCATGLALAWGGTPLGAAQSCLTFAAFSYVMDRYSGEGQRAHAAQGPRAAAQRQRGRPRRAPGALFPSRGGAYFVPPLALPALGGGWGLNRAAPGKGEGKNFLAALQRSIRGPAARQ